MAATTTESGSAVELGALDIPQLGRRGRRWGWAALALLSIVAVVALAYLWLRPSESVTLYRSVPVERRDVVQTIEATGRLDATLRMEVAAPVSGRLAEVMVEPGDTVTRGQVLGRLDDRAAALDVRGALSAQRAARFRVTQARTAVNQAQREQQHLEALHRRGLASAQELASAGAVLEQARATAEIADAELSLAARDVAGAGLRRSMAELCSPIDGVVLWAPEHPGGWLAPELGAPFVVGSELRTMRILADVSEADIGQIEVGQRAQFEVQAFPGREFDAVVEARGLEGSRQEAVVIYPVRLAVDNADGRLLPAMTATVRIVVDQARDVLAVRDAALRFEPEGAGAAAPRSRVFRSVPSGGFEAVRVSAGLSDGTYTQVRPAAAGALRQGDAVLVGRVERLPSGEVEAPGVSLGPRR